jgi:hypothetical protein
MLNNYLQILGWGVGCVDPAPYCHSEFISESIIVVILNVGCHSEFISESRGCRNAWILKPVQDDNVGG